MQARNAVVVLLDCLNRHMLGRLRRHGVRHAEPRPLRPRAVRFTQHYTGSLPCMPARHDLLVGALDFLWRPWGSIEIWEEPITALLRRAGVVTKLVTDHPHLFEIGGENYHVDFTRLGLPARTRERRVAHAARPELDRRAAVRPRPHRPTTTRAVGSATKTTFPGRARCARRRAGSSRKRRRTTASCCSSTSSIRTSRSTRRSRTRRCTTRSGRRRAPHLAAVHRAARSRRACSPSATARQIRASTARKLTMIDAWFGRVLDALDRTGRLGRHRGDRVHRSRPLPRREGHLGQARLPRSTSRSATSRCWSRGRGSRRRSRRRSPPTSTSTRRSATSSASTPRHRTHGRSLAPLVDGADDVGARLGAGRRLGPRGAPDRPTTRSTRARRPARTSRSRCGRTAGRRCRSTRIPDLRLPLPDDRAVLDRMPGLEGAGDPPAVRRRRLRCRSGRTANSRARWRSTSARIPAKTATSPATRSARAWRGCCTTRSSRWTPPTINSCGSATDRPQEPGEFGITAAPRHGWPRSAGHTGDRRQRRRPIRPAARCATRTLRRGRSC